MKAILLAVIFLASTMNVAQEQKPENDACKFTVSQDSNVPSIAGPENLTPLVYVVQQPDSPIEIVSVDLQGMWLSVLTIATRPIIAPNIRFATAAIKAFDLLRSCSDSMAEAVSAQ